MIVKSEGQRLFDAHTARAHSAVRKCARDNFGGAFVFLPDAHLHRIAQGFAHPSFFKCRGDENRLARARHNHGKKSFAQMPANAREVVKRRARPDKQRVEFRIQLAHQFLRAQQAPVEFIRRDGVHAVTQRLQG